MQMRGDAVVTSNVFSKSGQGERKRLVSVMGAAKMEGCKTMAFSEETCIPAHWRVCDPAISLGTRRRCVYRYCYGNCWGWGRSRVRARRVGTLVDMTQRSEMVRARQQSQCGAARLPIAPESATNSQLSRPLRWPLLFRGGRGLDP